MIRGGTVHATSSPFSFIRSNPRTFLTISVKLAPPPLAQNPAVLLFFWQTEIWGNNFFTYFLEWVWRGEGDD